MREKRGVRATSEGERRERKGLAENGMRERGVGEREWNEGEGRGAGSVE